VCLHRHNHTTPYGAHLADADSSSEDSDYPDASSDPTAAATQDFMNDALVHNSVATCTWQWENQLCPPHLLETCLGTGRLNW